MSILPSENERPDMASTKAKLNIRARATTLSSSSACWSTEPPWLSPTKSHGAVPFSWEDEPGVPKRLINLALPRKPTNSNNTTTKISQQQQLLLRPPPLLCSKLPDRLPHHNKLQTQHRHHSDKKKGGRSKDDPFVAALVKCTKHGHRQGKDEFIDHNRGFSSNIFSCLSKACSVRESQIILPRFSLSERKLGPSPQPNEHRKMINSKQCKALYVEDSPKETDKLFYYAVPSSELKF